MGIPRVRPSRCHPWDGAAKGWIGVRATLGTRWPPGKWPETQSRSAPPLSPQKVTAQPMAAKDIPQNAGLAKRPKGKEGGMRRADSRTPTWPRERGEPNRNGSWDGAAAPTPHPVPPPVAPHRSRAGIGAVRAESAIGAAARRAEPAALGRGSDRGETRNRNPRPAERRTGADPEGRSEPRNASRGPLKVTQLPAKPRTAPPLSRRPRQPTPKPGLKIPRVAPVGPLGAAPCGWLGGGGWHAVLTGCHLRK